MPYTKCLRLKFPHKPKGYDGVTKSVDTKIGKCRLMRNRIFTQFQSISL